MLYNTRCKAYPDGSLQYFHSQRLLLKDVPRMEVGKGSHPKHIERVSLSRTIQECYDIAKSSSWDYFFTLTFNSQVVDRRDYSACCDEMKKFTLKLRRRGCKYLFVPELHKDGAFHFHGLVSGHLDCLTVAHSPYSGEVLLDDSCRIIYNAPIYKSGFSTVTQIGDSGAASNYLMKYLNKELAKAVPPGKKRYWCSRDLARPEKSYFLESDDSFAIDFMWADFRKVIDTKYGKFFLCEHRPVSDWEGGAGT